MMLEYAVLDHRGPIAIRYPRGSGYETEALQQPVIPGKGLKIKSGEDVTIVAVGNFLKAALKTADLLEAEGISCEVINPRFIKPIDEPLLRESIRRTGRIVVMEDGITSGGLGSSILEFLCRAHACKIPAAGLSDEAIAHGSRDLIYKKYGLDPQSISDRILDFIGTSNQKGGRAWERTPRCDPGEQTII